MRINDPRLVALLGGLALLAGCGASQDDEDGLRPRVLVGSVSVSDFEERIEASGELVARDRAAIASEVAGRVTRITALEGDAVEEGALLLVIDPEKHRLQVATARARLQELKASLEEAEREFARISTLHERGIASASNLDEKRSARERNRSRFDAARAELGVAERALREANVRAPFAGYLARRVVSRGEYVKVGQALFELVSLDPIELEFNVAERDSARVAQGQVVRVRVAPWPDEHFEGVVSVVAPTIDTTTRTLRVKARIKNPDGRLRPGLFARADLGLALRRNVVWVPAAAVQLRAQGEVVWVVAKDDRVRRVHVKTGLHRDDKVEVLSGLSAGDEVVVRGHTGLSDGLQVLRRDADGAPPPAATPSVTAEESGARETL